MAERTPFERLFDPDNAGTLTGLIGRASGNQTQSERHGALISEALSEWSRLQGEGQSPQQAFIGLMQTEPGRAVFRTPGGMKAMQDAISGATPPAPTVASPGSAVIDRWGNRTDVKTTGQQDFEYFKELGQLGPDELKEIAQIQLLPAEDRKLATINRLVRQGKISQELGDHMMAPNAVEVVQGTDYFGNKVNQFFLANKVRGTITPLGGGLPSRQPGSAVPAPQAPSENNPMGLTDPGKASMFLGTGIIPATMAHLDDWTRNLAGANVGSEAGDVASQRRRQVQQLDAAVTSFPEKAGRTNIVVEVWRKMQPRMFGNPLDSYNAGIQLWEMVDREITADEAIITGNDPMISPEVKKEAAARIAGYRQIMRALPDYNDMRIMREQLLRTGGGSANITTAIEGIGEIVSKGGDALTNQLFNTQPKPSPQQPQQPQAPQPQGAVQPDPSIPDAAAILKMNEQQLRALVPKAGSMTPEQRTAAYRRVQELKSQGKAPRKQ